MRISNRIALAGVGMFGLVCTAAQFLRRDLDWTAAPLSFYLTGPGGWIVKCAYVALSLALLAIGNGFRSVLAATARSALAPALFAVSAVALAVTAFSEVPPAVDPSGLRALVHGIAAMTTFLCVTVAMLLQAWCLRGDPRWRASFGFAFGLALVAFAALWIHALVHALPRGLAQKSVIALILLWLGWAALALRRRSAR